MERNDTASTTYDEPLELLPVETRDTHRAIVSLMEDLEAIDWYQQRADATSDPELQEVLIHNKNEEIEHAAMVLEWIRRRNDHFDRMLRTYLFSELPITTIENDKRSDGGRDSTNHTLGIGSSKEM